MKIVIALDSFKGSCSAQAACAAVPTALLWQWAFLTASTSATVR